MQKVLKGDEVIVLTGRDKKKRGTVLARLNKDYVLVEGVNIVKKHVKANPSTNNPGGIIEKPTRIHVSNIALFNAATGKGGRVKILVVDGRKVRAFCSNDAVIVGAKA